MNNRKPSESDLRQALEFCEGSVTRTAQFYGVSRTTLYNWMRDHGIKRQPSVFEKAA